MLAPAGNFEKLEIAIQYGADAVYLAGKDFSLRNLSGNFSDRELIEGVELARRHDVKTYLACNIYSRNDEQDRITDFLKFVDEVGPDAIIIADPGIFMEARKIIPHIPIHLSTQINTTNYRAALFWQELGAERINIARELSLKDIAAIRSKATIELEAFVHGAMCISYSGRCLLSSFMANRDGNRGLCAQPCRWQYALVEEKRPGSYFPVCEDDRGTYFFNSRDLCMVADLPLMIASGVDSLKIEGRMKSIHYLATTLKVYREAIDTYYHNPDNYQVRQDWLRELAGIRQRGYSTGFYFEDPDQIIPDYEKVPNVPAHKFAGKILDAIGPGKVRIEVRNKILRGDTIEIFSPAGPAVRDRVIALIDDDGNSLDCAQPNSRVTMLVENEFQAPGLIRKIKNPKTSD